MILLNYLNSKEIYQGTNLFNFIALIKNFDSIAIRSEILIIAFFNNIQL